MSINQYYCGLHSDVSLVCCEVSRALTRRGLATLARLRTEANLHVWGQDLGLQYSFALNIGSQRLRIWMFVYSLMLLRTKWTTVSWSLILLSSSRLSSFWTLKQMYSLTTLQSWHRVSASSNHVEWRALIWESGPPWRLMIVY